MENPIQSVGITRWLLLILLGAVLTVLLLYFLSRFDLGNQSTTQVPELKPKLNPYNQADDANTQATRLPEVKLPELELLSETEIQALSPAERAHYKAMQNTFWELKRQAKQLNRERDQLSERLDKMEEQNKALSEALQKLRE